MAAKTAEDRFVSRLCERYGLKEVPMPNSYIPEGGVWTAEHESWNTLPLRDEVCIPVPEGRQILGTVAALIAANKALTGFVVAAYPQASEDDPMATKAWECVEKSNALLEALR